MPESFDFARGDPDSDTSLQPADLRSAGFLLPERNPQHGSNDLPDRARYDRLRLGVDRALAADLAGVEYGFNARGEIQLEKKDDMKKRGPASPDIADALALTFALPVTPGWDLPPVEMRHGRRSSQGAINM